MVDHPIMERPILFSGLMVKAILDGKKTQTRRVMKPQPSSEFSPVAVEWYEPVVIDRDGEEQPGSAIYGAYDEEEGYRCPYGQPGDRLWVRETWNAMNGQGQWWHDVKASKAERQLYNWAWTNPIYPALQEIPPKWLPSIHMPRAASRITLEVVKIRVEQVQDISEEDAVAEGCMPWHENGFVTDTAVSDYAQLWNEINLARGFGWDANPWVWVVEFKKVAR